MPIKKFIFKIFKYKFFNIYLQNKKQNLIEIKNK